MSKQAHQLTLYGHTPLPQALATPCSEAEAFIGGETFTNYAKNHEADNKLRIASVERQDALIKAFVNLGKTLVRAMTRGR